MKFFVIYTAAVLALRLTIACCCFHALAVSDFAVPVACCLIAPLLPQLETLLGER